MKGKITQEEVSRFRKLQEIKRMINLSKISKERQNQLNLMVLELILAGTDRDQIAQVLAIREGLEPDDQRALQTILSTI